MIANTGAFNPFAWHSNRRDIRTYVIYKLKDIDFILTGEYTSAKLVNMATNAETGLTVTTQTYDVGGNTLVRTRITGTLASNTTYYINVDDQIFTDCIQKTTCGIEVEASNLCDDMNYAWGTDPAPVGVNLDDAVQSEVLEFEVETLQIVTEQGTFDKAKRQKKYTTVEAVLPRAFFNMLSAMAISESISVGGLPVKNVTVSKEDQQGGMSKVVLKFQFIELENKNACCDELNLDTISQTGVGGGGGSCTGYAVSIANASGTLTATASGIAGTSIYKWYRNGQFVSSGAVLVTNGVYGEYRVEATNSGCYTASSIYLADPCDAMTIEAFVTNNSINANIENEISGTTYEVRLNGSLLSTSLPYTALTTGTYYVYAIAGNCKKVSGVYVVIQNTDCDYTIGIDQNNNELTATTDAASPTYTWEIETPSGGRVPYATTQVINMAGDGIYWLTIASGTCEKEDYHLKQDNKPRIINVLTRQQGYEFNVYDIPLLDVSDPAIELEVYVNGTVQTYSPSTPTSTNVYSIKADGKLIIWSGAALTNGTIKIVWNR